MLKTFLSVISVLDFHLLRLVLILRMVLEMDIDFSLIILPIIQNQNQQGTDDQKERQRVNLILDIDEVRNSSNKKKLYSILSKNGFSMCKIKKLRVFSNMVAAFPNGPEMNNFFDVANEDESKAC